MNDIRIKYSGSSYVRGFVIFSAIAYAILGFYLSVSEALLGQYGFSFYAGLVVILLSIILVLSFTLWRSKPLVVINADFIAVNIANQKHIPQIEWATITEFGIGISYLKIFVDSKSYDVDLSSLIYSDLKLVKSKIIELCESKNIPYHNI